VTDLFRPFGLPLYARFIRRPNRFLVECDYEGRVIRAYLPNPGRLQELLLPDSRLLIVEEETPGRATRFTVVGVVRDDADCPIMLHTGQTNAAARHLLEKRLIPGLEGAAVVRQEVTVGRSRFDFLLRDGSGNILLEVKSCTLFGRRVAMFPDAVTARGTRHLEDLASAAGKGMRAAVLFIVHGPHPDTFMPDYHTDLRFSRTLLAVRESVCIIPVAVRWMRDLSLSNHAALLDIPWPYIEKEAQDRGSYIIILFLAEDRFLDVGRAGRFFFRKGFYLYVGSAMASLTARIERHVRKRKRFHWHIDWLRSVAAVHAVLPIRSPARLECTIAEALRGHAAWSIPGFGCTDCDCDSHLFGSPDDPLRSAWFQRLLLSLRMDRYDGPTGRGRVIARR
jgi:sugar fermentation stimulation protein A